MIKDIVEMVLKEARGREGHTTIFNIYRVCIEIQTIIMDIMDKAMDEERRKKHD